MKLIESFLTKNPCYKTGRKITVKGLMLHSIGCPQPSAKVLINLWNDADYDSACVHGFIDGNDGTVYQTLPWDHRGWHAGGLANNTHIGIEMCEPSCIKYIGGATFSCSNAKEAKAVVKRTYDSAVELFAMLCEKFNLDPLSPGVILSHKEGSVRGVASSHADPEHLWTQLNTGYTMSGFRRDVSNKMKENAKKGGDKEMVRYNAVSEMPDYAKPTITKLIDLKYLNGYGKSKDKDGRPSDLDLSIDTIRILVVLDRAGLFDESD